MSERACGWSQQPKHRDHVRCWELSHPCRPSDPPPPSACALQYSPPGLLSIAQFRHAWKKFSVRVSEEQAHAIFIKYGCDTQVRESECEV